MQPPPPPTTGHQTNNKLLQAIQFQIIRHLSDPDLSVSKLLRYVGISRTDLHRKLIQLVGMSATEYIRHIRLRRAAALLLTEPEWSIGQIACEVGFNSQSYFTRSFIEAFGMCPRAFRKTSSELLGRMEHI